jgi:HSP90 family molecular chaperone
MTSAPETLEFQAETKALLRLVTLTRSMQTRDIFLRELISNASRRVGSATG